jgi:hypothetical protein
MGQRQRAHSVRRSTVEYTAASVARRIARESAVKQRQRGTCPGAPSQVEHAPASLAASLPERVLLRSVSVVRSPAELAKLRTAPPPKQRRGVGV